MNRLRLGGGLLTVAGLSAYGAGVLTVYPGRGLSLAVVMIGLALLAIGGVN
ncbi:MAG: hypothetical protein ABEH64_10760 [Salinirussus sp.]